MSRLKVTRFERRHSESNREGVAYEATERPSLTTAGVDRVGVEPTRALRPTADLQSASGCRYRNLSGKESYKPNSKETQAQKKEARDCNPPPPLLHVWSHAADHQ